MCDEISGLEADQSNARAQDTSNIFVAAESPAWLGNDGCQQFNSVLQNSSSFVSPANGNYELPSLDLATNVQEANSNNWGPPFTSHIFTVGSGATSSNVVKLYAIYHMYI